MKDTTRVEVARDTLVDATLMLLQVTAQRNDPESLRLLCDELRRTLGWLNTSEPAA